MDRYAYGVTFDEIVDLGGIGPEGDSTRGRHDCLNRDTVEVSIDTLLRLPFRIFCSKSDHFEYR